MDSASDENKLRPCLTRIIDAIDSCIQKLNNPKEKSAATTTSQQPSDNSDDSNASSNGPLSTSVSKFTLDTVENDLLDQLTTDIENILDGCLPHLSPICFSSFTDYLYQYHYDREKKKFSRPLPKNALHSMRQDLKGFLGKFT